jgi:hypothetical protein
MVFHPAAAKTHSWTGEAQPGALEAYNGETRARFGATEAYNRVIEASPKAIVACSLEIY